MRLSSDCVGVADAESRKLARVHFPRLPCVPLPLVFVVVCNRLNDAVKVGDVTVFASISACVRVRRILGFSRRVLFWLWLCLTADEAVDDGIDDCVDEDADDLVVSLLYRELRFNRTAVS